MRIRYLVLIALAATVALVLVAACGNKDQVTKLENQVTKLEKENKILSEIAGPPPASLAQYYPPQAQAPIWLIEMFNLVGPFEGIGVDLQEGDVQGAKANYDAFKAQYNKVSGMVPEWKGRFPPGPVDDLGKALDSGDPAKVGPAMGQVGQVCGS
ncbi:MAG: hypothetical protein Q8R28_16780, partial [Dehalococcoidia bacterium]|nr:hypothetical protein [Dehalococcoidia bacterium]